MKNLNTTCNCNSSGWCVIWFLQEELCMCAGEGQCVPILRLSLFTLVSISLHLQAFTLNKSIYIPACCILQVLWEVSSMSITGGGSNYLCLPMDPEWGEHDDDDIFEDRGIIYGAEYEGNFPFSMENVAEGSNAIFDHNVPCAVCQSRVRSTVLMVPAKKSCHDGWTLEYHGYLVSAHHAHAGRTEYGCMDRAPEADPAGYIDQNGVLFYDVEGACGSLPCPPYVNGREITCAVCSK